MNYVELCCFFGWVITYPMDPKQLLRRYLTPKSNPKHFLRRYGWIHMDTMTYCEIYSTVATDQVLLFPQTLP